MNNSDHTEKVIAVVSNLS